jgi:hypothetical protein
LGREKEEGREEKERRTYLSSLTFETTNALLAPLVTHTVERERVSLFKLAKKARCESGELGEAGEERAGGGSAGSGGIERTRPEIRVKRGEEEEEREARVGGEATLFEKLEPTNESDLSPALLQEGESSIPHGYPTTAPMPALFEQEASSPFPPLTSLFS